jgi:hypothetical protein
MKAVFISVGCESLIPGLSNWFRIKALIGGCPVMKGKGVVGMVTQTDLFHIFLQMMKYPDSFALLAS